MPYKIPDCIFSVVSSPMTLSGIERETCGNFAAFENKADIPDTRPGAITPPKYAPSGEMQSKVIAVP